MMERILLGMLGLYRGWLSPALHAAFPSGCKYRPTCSEYAQEAIALHGAGQGTWMALKRLLRCHPLARGGFDPVPLPKSDGHADPRCATAGALHDPLP
jgi:hypothetical protein